MFKKTLKMQKVTKIKKSLKTLNKNANNYFYRMVPAPGSFNADQKQVIRNI